jgi:hypothetical protein
VLFDQAAATKLPEPLEHGVHRRAYLGGTGSTEVGQELLTRFEPIGRELVRVPVFLCYCGQEGGETL